MISSKREYLEYLQADKKANHIGKDFRSRILITWKYIKCLRKLEYVLNCKKGMLSQIELYYLKYKWYRLSVKTGITLPPNTFGKGVYIPHFGAIVVNPSARFGDYCVIQNGVNISNDVIGRNHIYLGAGAKIMIGVHIEDDVIVGANAVVTKDIDEPNIVVAGLPAKKISGKGFRDRKTV